MNTSEPISLQAARWLALASAVACVFSIAASQIFLALALATLLISGASLRLPRIWIPVACWMAWTVLSLVFSDDPGDGISQIRKFYVYLEFVVVYCALRDTVWVRRLFLSWTAAATITSLRGFVQFAHIGQRPPNMSFYEFYINNRITGFMSHWMTYAGELMFVLVAVMAFLFFSPAARKRSWPWMLCAGIMAAALVLSFTRGVAFMAVPAALAYVVWFWRPRALWAVPVLLVVGFFVSPAWIRTRVTSMVEPGRLDSNQFRKVAWRTGWEMVKKHPIFGLGPERVKARFNEFVPTDTPRPLPDGWYGHLHNIYVHYAAERGIPALLILLWWLGQMLWDFYHGARRLPPDRSDARMALVAAGAAVVAILVEGIVELNLGDSEVLGMFLAMTACGYIALRKATEDAAG